MQCTHKTQVGKPCKAPAKKGRRYCFHHDPALARERAKARKLGGLNRGTKHGEINPASVPTVRTVADVLQLLDYARAEIVVMENGVARDRLLISLASGYLSAFEVGELETRVAALEQQLRGAQ